MRANNCLRVLLTGLVLGVGLGVGPAQAQDNRPRLQIVVEEMDEDAAKCGLSMSGVESTAALTLRNNGVLTAPNTSPWLYVNVSVLFQESSRRCAANVRVAIQATGDERKVGSFTLRRNFHSTFVLCQRSGIATASQATSGRYFSELIEENIKACLSRLEC